MVFVFVPKLGCANEYGTVTKPYDLAQPNLRSGGNDNFGKQMRQNKKTLRSLMLSRKSVAYIENQWHQTKEREHTMSRPYK